MMGDKIRLTLEGFGICIPDLNDVVACLGTDREAIDNILTVLGDVFNHCCNGVAHKGGAGLAFQNAETVSAAIDIVVILPERGDIVAH